MHPHVLITALAQPFVTSGRSAPPEPPTGGELVLAGVIVTFIGLGGLLGARLAWTQTPEQLAARPGRARMRAALGGSVGSVGFLLLYAYLLVWKATGEPYGPVQVVLGALGTAGMVLGGLYAIVYYWVRLPDWLLPPPQRGRGGQWNGPDGRPAR